MQINPATADRRPCRALPVRELDTHHYVGKGELSSQIRVDLEWQLDIDLKITAPQVTWATLVQLQIVNNGVGDWSGTGNVPAMFLLPNSQKAHFCFPIDGANSCFTMTQDRVIFSLFEETLTR